MRTTKFSNHLWMTALLLSTAFPSMFDLCALSGKVKSWLDAYLAKLCGGDLDREMGLV